MPVSVSSAACNDGTKLVEIDVYEYIVVAMNCAHNTFHILTVKLQRRKQDQDVKTKAKSS